MDIRLTVTRAGPTLTSLEQEVLSKSIVRGGNRTLDEMQRHTRKLLSTWFTIRTAKSKRFLEGMIVINADDKFRATAGQGRAGVPYVGRMGIQQNTRGRDRARQLRKFILFELGGREESEHGTPLAVPTDSTRTSPQKAIPMRDYPRALGLLDRQQIAGGFGIQGLRRGSKGGVLLQGKRRSFAIDPRFHRTVNQNVYGVWRRIGRGRGNDEVELRWSYHQSLRVPRRMRFVEEGTRLARERFAVNVSGFVAVNVRRLVDLRAKRAMRGAGLAT